MLTIPLPTCSGFLPHSGKGITLPVAVSGFKRALNIADDFTTVLWTAAFLVSKDPASATWDLSDVVQHSKFARFFVTVGGNTCALSR